MYNNICRTTLFQKKIIFENQRRGICALFDMQIILKQGIEVMANQIKSRAEHWNCDIDNIVRRDYVYFLTKTER